MSDHSLSPREAFQKTQTGVRLIDIRGEDERMTGVAQGATGVDMDALLGTPARFLDATPALLICQKGIRSGTATARLRSAGYVVFSVDGGLDAWRAAGLPVETPAALDEASTEDPHFADRYSRQMRLPQLGVAGQLKLRASHVVLVGAGGLGSPAAFYLAAAGVGRLTLVDHDRVDRSNLQRQILHTDAAVGAAKVDSARERLLALNPHLGLVTAAVQLDGNNASSLIAGADVVIDGSDNFAVRHALNAACIAAQIPLVYGAVDRFTGQASVFNAGKRGQVPCYRCLFPEAPEGVQNCAEAGVLGVVPGLVGLIQATETLKLLSGIGQTLSGFLLQFDALDMQFKRSRLRADPACPACGIGGCDNTQPTTDG